MAEATILDPCCGGRMMWFDRQDQRALFGDIRSEAHTLCDGRAFNITPDLNMDFRAMPFAAGSFSLVVFDPPHLRRAGRDSWLRAKYGILGDDWQDDLRRGLAECFRVLKPAGVLIFKWAEVQIPVSQILVLTEHRPLFGHKSGKREKTHWLTFMKPADTDKKEM
ncbi:class I SAM-dependent methyltransferase [Achromobacter xylosoxidans]|uniref:Class I SAM-dependent methyltransferase n=1 Tax=Alcaligenes xylosoxydans xylosoxydans TaxID=85698 RepID=A0A0X8NXU7_ALCXX|nr:class I SAM-dependent methyltransferase [Achromobacter xylosoxidans]AMG36289.1 class I SAM-dependent methyltransferase [Achromobacter xylosoxidans]